jgi:hypothetical protein
LTSPRHYTPDRQDAYATLLSPDRTSATPKNSLQEPYFVSSSAI